MQGVPASSSRPGVQNITELSRQPIVCVGEEGEKDLLKMQ